MPLRRVLAVSYRPGACKRRAVCRDVSETSLERRVALLLVKRSRAALTPREACERPAPKRSAPPVKGTIALLVGPA